MSRTPSIRPHGPVTLRDALTGRAVDARTPAEWRHPWHVRPAWTGTCWVCTVNAGFVNGVAPILRTTVVDQEQAGRSLDVNPLTGEPWFSADVFTQPTAEATSRTVEIPLYLHPAIPLSWRSVGYDGPAGVAVPQFFLDRGAQNSPQRGLSPSGDSALEFDLSRLTAPRPEGLRLLRVCDLWLRQPRAALTATTTISPSGLATGLSLVQQQLTAREPDAEERLQILSGTYEPLLTAQIDALEGDYQEAAWDELHLAKVWLLSPPNPPEDVQPSGAWQAFVEQSQFWNLCHRAQDFRVLPLGDPEAGLAPGAILAGGAAAPLLNWITASLNDAFNRAANILQAHSLVGTFWVPTGGGDDATFPAAESSVPAGRTGGDKSGRLQSAVLAQQRAKAQASLNPRFPYHGTGSLPPNLFAQA